MAIDAEQKKEQSEEHPATEPMKLAMLLDHEYTEANLSFKNLKGRDLERAIVRLPNVLTCAKTTIIEPIVKRRANNAVLCVRRQLK